MASSYKGPERRNKHDSDHDTLIVMVQILQDHVNNFDKHIQSYQDHVKDDKVQFESIRALLQKILNYKYMILGGFIVINVIFKIFWKI